LGFYHLGAKLGRLLRKKASSGKKKKKRYSDGTVAQKETNRAAKQHAEVLNGPSGEAKKRQLPPPSKSSSANRSASRMLKIGFLKKAVQFLREVKMELKKVTWPTRKQTIGSTAVVILLVMIISLFLGVVDIGLSNLFHVVMQ
jgi:preprotein translocase subunit SecE